jgi:cytochrome c-type biogenesis protein CcmH
VRVALPLLVLAAALVVGSGAFSGKPQTSSQRAASIESVVKCPSCPDLSVAESDESTALAVRHEIVRMVGEGRSTAQIERTLVAQYGRTILLEPPATDGINLIWVLPIVLGLGALAIVGVFFVRRSRQFAELRSQLVEVDPAGEADG